MDERLQPTIRARSSAINRRLPARAEHDNSERWPEEPEETRRQGERPNGNYEPAKWRVETHDRKSDSHGAERKSGEHGRAALPPMSAVVPHRVILSMPPSPVDGEVRT